jgi:plasmid stabilization system protein ParE
MEYRVKIMPRAERDLSGIYDWIGAHSSGAALTWYHGLRDAIRTLRFNSNRCPMTPEDRHLRHLLYGTKPHTYRVIYRILEKQKQVHVLHIRHAARQEFKAGELT